MFQQTVKLKHGVLSQYKKLNESCNIVFVPGTFFLKPWMSGLIQATLLPIVQIDFN